MLRKQMNTAILASRLSPRCKILVYGVIITSIWSD